MTAARHACSLANYRRQRLAALASAPLGLGGKRADEIGRRGYLRDEVDRLAGPHRVLGQVAARHGLAVGLPGGGVGRKLILPAAPLVEERVAQSAGRVLRWPRRFHGDVGTRLRSVSSRRAR